MAKLLPDLAPPAAYTAGQYVERQLLATLARGLPAAYTLFHDVDWAGSPAGREPHGGEIDIVAVNRAGDLLLIEVKAGAVEFGPQGIVRRHGGTRRNVGAQIKARFAALKARLREADLAVHLGHLLVLTHVQVDEGTAQWPRERIVDGRELPSLAARVMQLLPPAAESPVTGRVLHFFENRFRVAADVGAFAPSSLPTARLAAGLATWVPRIAAPSGIVRVDGAAGSGKSQLALRMLRDADAAGRRGAYVCFSRALADRVARVAPPHTQVHTFHELAQQVCRAVSLAPDLNAEGVFDAMAAQAIGLLQARAPDLDVLVVDELHDLQPAWVEALLWRLRENGRALLLEDRDQRLYDDRLPFVVPEAVGIECAENFRSPRALVRLVNTLRLASREIEALGPADGEAPEPIVCDSAQAFERGTIKAVERCLARGHALADIAVVTLQGRERSRLLDRARLGPWTLKTFGGRFDDGGNAIWSEGELLVETVRRFKGQCAPAVVLTECDLPQLRPLDRRLLYVGLTRAQAHLEWVMTGATDAALKAAQAA